MPTREAIATISGSLAGIVETEDTTNPGRIGTKRPSDNGRQYSRQTGQNPLRRVLSLPPGLTHKIFRTPPFDQPYMVFTNSLLLRN